MAKTADKYNRRNIIDLLDKMDYQINILKCIIPLLALQSAAFLTGFVFLMKEIMDVSYKAGKNDAIFSNFNQLSEFNLVFEG